MKNNDLKTKERSQLVVKDNDLILRAKYNLTATQQKIIAYTISKIKPTDRELKWIEIKVVDFCELCGIDKQGFYKEFQEIIDDLDNKSFWVETERKVYKFRWFSESEYIKGTGTVRVLLNSNLRNYLLDLSSNFTQYELYNILALKSKYSFRLYEIFKADAFKTKIEYDIDKLKELLSATNYKNFNNLKTRVLDKAIEEINYYTDISISYDTINSGKKVIGIRFNIQHKESVEGYIAYRNTIEKINERNSKTNMDNGENI